MSRKTVSELQRNINNVKKQIQDLRWKKELLESGNSVKVEEEVVDKVEKEEQFLKKEMKKYKRIKKECLSIFSQSMEKKMGEVAEIMGVEL